MTMRWTRIKKLMIPVNINFWRKNELRKATKSSEKSTKKAKKQFKMTMPNLERRTSPREMNFPLYGHGWELSKSPRSTTKTDLTKAPNPLFLFN
jgi:hypothetical protein